MKVLKRIKCFSKSVVDYFKYGGAFIMHNFIEVERTPCIIIATDTSFRVSDNYQHDSNETVYKNATLIRSKCKYCDVEDLSWIDNTTEIPVIKE